MEPFAVLCVLAYGVAMAVIGYLTAFEDPYPDDQEADDTERVPPPTARVVGSLVAGAHRSPTGAVGSDDPGHH